MSAPTMMKRNYKDDGLRIRYRWNSVRKLAFARWPERSRWVNCRSEGLRRVRLGQVRCSDARRSIVCIAMMEGRNFSTFVDSDVKWKKLIRPFRNAVQPIHLSKLVKLRLQRKGNSLKCCSRVVTETEGRKCRGDQAENDISSIWQI